MNTQVYVVRPDGTALEVVEGCTAERGRSVVGHARPRATPAAVDLVRRAEHKELMAAGDATLQGSRQLAV